MVFPIGAQIWELAADHLDRLPGKSLIDRLVHETRVTLMAVSKGKAAQCCLGSATYKNTRAARSNEPEQGRERRGNKTDGNADNQQTSPELRGGRPERSDLEVASVQLADAEHARHHKDDIKEQQPVGQQGVDAEHEEDDGIVAGEVAQVVVDAGLHLAKVGRLGQALEVEELGDGAQVGEAAAQRSRAQALEALSQVEAGRDEVEGDLDARHFG